MHRYVFLTVAALFALASGGQAQLRTVNQAIYGMD